MVRAIADLDAKEEHLCAFDVPRKGECMNSGSHEEVVVEFDPFFELLVEINEGDAVGEVPSESVCVGLCVGFGKAFGVDSVGVTPYFMTLRRVRNEVSIPCETNEIYVAAVNVPSNGLSDIHGNNTCVIDQSQFDVG